MASKVETIVPLEDNPTLAGGVVVNGTTLPADFVIMGVGVAPATEYLRGSGIQIEKDGGVKVDQYLRVQSGPDTNDVYAIGVYLSYFLPLSKTLMLRHTGDIAIYPQIAGGHTRIEHWNVNSSHLVESWVLMLLMLGCGESWKSGWKDYCGKSTAICQGSHLLECWYVVSWCIFLFSVRCYYYEGACGTVVLGMDMTMSMSRGMLLSRR
jgi:Pyridine nucleotide-disulphide oxidoreductase